ncbi:STAS domain-containing protein [Micromonospora rifamycinica]|uniref:Anti-anti-sigma factor n=1 Tax=Micromonospora rifamycinica TaxID=291594 RepID=A0A109IKC3_9ACTN|nr:STAS domain-containing protein [Micromonospora rifamycinica]KWV32084.1 anti-anti-sigma factor [Micromonospora rifamycinica]SCG41922.1 anti-anti-sigma factor [Micromonospora rifamycinica]
MNTPLDLATGLQADGAPVLTVVGEIDMSNADLFRTAIADAVVDGHRLTVDLTAVEYLDSAALAALFAHVDQLRVVANPLLDSVLTISGLRDLTTVTIRD